MVARALEWSVQHKCSLWRALGSQEFLAEVSARTAASIRAFVELVGDYETKLTEPLSNPAALVTKLIEEIGYAAELRRNCKTAEEAAARESNVQDILRDLAQFLGRSTERPAWFSRRSRPRSRAGGRRRGRDKKAA